MNCLEQYKVTAGGYNVSTKDIDSNREIHLLGALPSLCVEMDGTASDHSAF